MAPHHGKFFRHTAISLQEIDDPETQLVRYLL